VGQKGKSSLGLPPAGSQGGQGHLGATLLIQMLVVLNVEPSLLQ
jgi:hypothetical protein